MSDTTLVTGFPAFTAKRLCRQLLATDPDERVFLLAREKFRADVNTWLGELPAEQRRRVEVLQGDVVDMDLGLTGAEYRGLIGTITAIHHTAAVYFRGAKSALMRKVNVDGTRSVLELAGDCSRLRRLVHWSTVQVAGTRSGTILEDELDCHQRFHDVYEESRFRAETLVHDAMRRIPTTVVRPGLVVGDSNTGEIDKLDGPYYLVLLIVRAPRDVSIPLPGRGDAPLNLVPIDFVVDAATRLGRDPRAAGRTFHLTDPAPYPARAVYELVAERAGRRPPRGTIPTGLARALLRAAGPRSVATWLERLGLEKLARAPIAFVEAFNHPAVYNCRNTLELLEGTGPKCPPFDGYVDKLVEYVQTVDAARRARGASDDTEGDALERESDVTDAPHARTASSRLDD
jgi:thioester reductase-like protein